MMGIDLKQIGQIIHEFFSEKVEVFAKQTKFVQRASKLTGTKFLQAIVFNSLEKREMTLSSMTQSCLDLGVSITEQGIDDRIDESSVSFLKEMARQSLNAFRLGESLPVQILEQFADVYVVDSSQISIPESMADLFPGCGGNASKASIKIQLVYDYLHGHLEQIELTNGRQPDQGYRGHWPLIQKGALFMMDLGYFVLDTFQEISQQQGYFLSRFQAQTAVMTPTGQRIELAKLLTKQQESIADYDVLIGSRPHHRIPCRLIAIRLPQEVADRQRQKSKDTARRHGRTVTKEWLHLLGYALFITNVPAHQLHKEHVPTLYRIRWQIELVFKMCKSFCGLDYIASLRSQRVLTEFYARLIGIALIYFLIAPVRLPFGPAHNREISPVKVRLIFQRFARSLSRALLCPDAFGQHMNEFFKHVTQFGFKQRRLKSPNSVHALALISACYEWLDIDIPDYDLLDFSLA
jgi:hypothetical protein